MYTSLLGSPSYESSKQTWVMDFQCDLTHAHCNILYEYIYMRLLFEGGYYYRYLIIPAVTIRGWLLFEVRRLFEEIRYIQSMMQYARTGDR